MVVPGDIKFGLDGPLLEIPATGAAGVPFLVQISTYGNGCVEHEATDVEVISSDLAVVTPLDRVRTSGVCTMEIKFIGHRADVRFDTPGNKTVLFRGHEYGAPPDRLIDVNTTIRIE